MKKIRKLFLIILKSVLEESFKKFSLKLNRSI